VGTRIATWEFDPADYSRFRERLEEHLHTLGRLLDVPGFGSGPATVGAELELVLVDSSGKPLTRNRDILAAVGDSRVTVELHRCNLELNATPLPLAGRPFTALGGELTGLLDRIAAAASPHDGKQALIGILPTMRVADLTQDRMTDTPRYLALNRGLRQLRRSPHRIRIVGDDVLDLPSDDIGPEGANTSFQLHLRVAPAEFTRTYNAVQLASGPALAVSGNSPTFLGRRLWDETRIALYKQAVDERDPSQPRRRPARTALGTGWLRGGALELITESVRLHPALLPVLSGRAEPDDDRRQPPGLDELRLHQSTVWRWNRAVYDPASGGHLRIEMRAMPSGPTVADMMANAAFLIGLTLWIAGQGESWTYALPFERTDHNFHRAAQHGLAAPLSWPTWRQDETRTTAARELVPELVPAARQGLLGAGVAAAEADSMLDVIAERAASGQTGAAWQRAALAAAETELDRDRALAAMLSRYLACSATGQPVHTWPAAASRALEP
jgi:gamma-glutamyl:cysteine ligase YbdK (ATP-grasp superfamily)